MSSSLLVIDTDPAIGLPFKDVDDGLALAYVLALPSEFEVVGISVVFGNAPLHKGLSRAVETLRVTRRDKVPVLRGAAGRKEIGSETPASRFLRGLADENPGRVTVLALGPLTNVATAGIRDPDFFEKLEGLVVMGGALEEGLGLPLVSPLEFNFFSDPEAADLVLEAPCEKVLITADLCRQAVFTPREIRALYRMENNVATWIANRSLPWLQLNRLAPFLPWKGGFVPWDVIAAVYLRKPGLFRDEVESGYRLKGGLLRTGVLAPDTARDSRPVTIPTSLDPDALLEEFLDVINLYPLA